MDFIVPASVPADARYHLFVVADPNDELAEFFEGDNVQITSEATFGTGYDLVVAGCRVRNPPARIGAGTCLTFEVRPTAS